MDIPTTGPSIACKLYPIPVKYQKFIDEEIRLLEIVGYISKSLSPLAAPVIIVPKKLDPLNPQMQQLHSVLDHWSLNKSINAAHNGIRIISYNPSAKHIRSSSKVAKVYNIFLIRS